jgi:hypothetical protein
MVLEFLIFVVKGVKWNKNDGYFQCNLRAWIFHMNIIPCLSELIFILAENVTMLKLFMRNEQKSNALF